MKSALCKYCNTQFFYECPTGGIILYCSKCRADYKRIKQRKDGVSQERWTKITEKRQEKQAKNKAYWATHNPFQETSCKKCSVCKTTKQSQEFGKSATAKNGLQSKCLSCSKVYYRTTIVKRLVMNAKLRAKRDNIDFNLEESDVIIPEICPVLGIPIIVGEGEQTDNSPSLDRWDNSKGYIKNNVKVVSWRANNIKGDASIAEFEKVLYYMKHGTN